MPGRGRQDDPVVLGLRAGTYPSASLQGSSIRSPRWQRITLGPTWALGIAR